MCRREMGSPELCHQSGETGGVSRAQEAASTLTRTQGATCPSPSDHRGPQWSPVNRGTGHAQAHRPNMCAQACTHTPVCIIPSTHVNITPHRVHTTHHTCTHARHTRCAHSPCTHMHANVCSKLTTHAHSTHTMRGTQTCKCMHTHAHTHTGPTGCWEPPFLSQASGAFRLKATTRARPHAAPCDARAPRFQRPGPRREGRGGRWRGRAMETNKTIRKENFISSLRMYYKQCQTLKM